VTLPRSARGVAVLAAAAALLAASGCASVGPSISKSDDTSVNLAAAQLAASNLQIMQGLLIKPAQLGPGWSARPETAGDNATTGQAGINACGVGVSASPAPLHSTEEYLSDSNTGEWLANQVLVYANSAAAGQAAGSFGGSQPSDGNLCQPLVGGSTAAKYLIGGTPVQGNWLSPQSVLVQIGNQTQAMAGLLQRRGRFVSIVYGPATFHGDTATDGSPTTQLGIQAATSQLNQLTDADTSN
jgi:hypothetical protein